MNASWLSILALLAAGLTGVARGQAITEFPLPSPGTGVGDIAAGPDGNLWFVASGSNFIGRITTDGIVTEVPRPATDGSLTSIVAGSDGNLWFTQGGRNKIGRITTGGDITEFSLPAAVSASGRIASGADGNLWYSGAGNKIGRITTAGVVTEFSVSVEIPYGMTAGPDGNIWFTQYYRDRIGRITPSGVVTEYSVTSDSWPHDITAGPDGNLWFLTAASTIGRMTADGHLVGEFPLPTLTSSPKRIVAGPDGNLWFTEGVGNKIGRITPAGDITEFSVPTAGSSPSGITLGPDGNLWFTEGSGKSIGRVVPEQQPSPSPCVASSTTLCLNGGRFQVRAEWQAPSLGTSGHGAAIALNGATGFFWFFEASSIEVVVKVLDGCALNGHAWVFAGGLTNVGVTMTVTDTQTGFTKTYTNPAGTAFQPIQDTAAFSTCP